MLSFLSCLNPFWNGDLSYNKGHILSFVSLKDTIMSHILLILQYFLIICSCYTLIIIN